jgi:hypothetical protein
MLISCDEPNLADAFEIAIVVGVELPLHAGGRVKGDRCHGSSWKRSAHDAICVFTRARYLACREFEFASPRISPAAMQPLIVRDLVQLCFDVYIAAPAILL